MSAHTTSRVTDDLFRQIRGEYAEMQGLSVTQLQAQRLWGLDEATCRLALDSLLVRTGFLKRTDAGQYVRLTDGPSTSRLPMGKATLRHVEDASALRR